MLGALLARLRGDLLASARVIGWPRGRRARRTHKIDPLLLKHGNSKLLGIEIYTSYLYPLQVAAVLLLVAIIAAIALTLRQRKDSRYQQPSEQVRVKKADRVRLVKMRPTIDAPAAAQGEGKAP